MSFDAFHSEQIARTVDMAFSSALADIHCASDHNGGKLTECIEREIGFRRGRRSWPSRRLCPRDFPGCSLLLFLLLRVQYGGKTAQQ